MYVFNILLFFTAKSDAEDLAEGVRAGNLSFYPRYHLLHLFLSLHGVLYFHLCSIPYMDNIRGLLVFLITIMLLAHFYTCKSSHLLHSLPFFASQGFVLGPRPDIGFTFGR